jgi:hypothetical protein
MKTAVNGSPAGSTSFASAPGEGRSSWTSSGVVNVSATACGLRSAALTRIAAVATLSPWSDV